MTVCVCVCVCVHVCLCVSVCAQIFSNSVKNEKSALIQLNDAVYWKYFYTLSTVYVCVKLLRGRWGRYCKSDRTLKSGDHSLPWQQLRPVEAWSSCETVYRLASNHETPLKGYNGVFKLIVCACVCVCVRVRMSRGRTVDFRRPVCDWNRRMTTWPMNWSPARLHFVTILTR